jgi:hypothetical protein
MQALVQTAGAAAEAKAGLLTCRPRDETRRGMMRLTCHLPARVQRRQQQRQVVVVVEICRRLAGAGSGTIRLTSPQRAKQQQRLVVPCHPRGVERSGTTLQICHRHADQQQQRQ